MENAAEALKIAFAVLLFVLALTLSISSFSQATGAVQAVTSIRDRESQYTYVNPSENLSRKIGLETIVSSVYRSYDANIKIYFFESDGKTEIPLYYDTNTDGTLKKDSFGQKIEMSSIELSTGFGTKKSAIEFLDVLFGGTANASSEIRDKYADRIIYSEGLYKKFKDNEFEEKLGEYYQGSGSTKIKKNVITYIMQP